jgi:tetratricopeptide (TPR) repeat protein
MRPLAARLARAAVLIALALLAVATPARAADPFYERLLRDGDRELTRGDFAAAARDLRIAAFGFLDEPVRLAAALVPLALAEAGLADGEAFEDTYSRIAEIEDRFGAYTKADLPADERKAFEQKVAALVPMDTLERSAAFRELARQKQEAQIARLPKRERRAQLEAQVAAAPQDPRWLLLLGRLELEDRNRPHAVELATRVLALDPGDQGALCLRGLAQAEADGCAAAVLDLEACADSATNPAVAAQLLDCLADLKRWGEARERLDALAAEVRDDRALAKVKKRIEKAPAADTDSAPAKGADAPATPPPPAAATAAAPPAKPPSAALPAPEQAPKAPLAPAPPPAKPTAADRQQLERARALLGEAKTAGDLDEASQLADDVAGRFPDATDAQLLAGEIAYRASRWPEAARYFRRAGDPGARRPELSFYMAVAFFESGDLEAARAALARALPRLQRTPFVEGYVQKILPPAPKP